MLPLIVEPVTERVPELAMPPPFPWTLPPEMVRLEDAAARDGQVGDRGRDALVHQEDPDGIVAADRQRAGPGAVDHLGTGRLGQLQRAGQCDRLGRGEHRGIKLDQTAGGVGVGVRLRDRRAQRTRVGGAIAEVGHAVKSGVAGKERPLLQPLHRPDPTAAPPAAWDRLRSWLRGAATSTFSPEWGASPGRRSGDRKYE